MPNIYLVHSPGQPEAAFFTVVANGADFDLTALNLPGGEVFALAERLTVPGALTAAIGGGPDMQFVAAVVDPGLTLRAHIQTGGGATPTFFGRRFDGAWGIDAYISIHIPGPHLSADAPDPYFRLAVWGRVDLQGGSGAVDFAIDALLFEVEIRNLPAALDTFTSEAWLSSPNFGIELPRLRLPAWQWPHLPAPSDIFGDPLSGSLGWNEELPFGCDGIRLTPSGASMALDVTNFRLGAAPGAIAGDLHVELANDAAGNVIFQNTRIMLTRPQATTVELSDWKVTDQTLTIEWHRDFVSALIGLLSPELAAVTPAGADYHTVLRLHWGEDGIDEARLDWEQGSFPLQLRPPGFEVNFPEVEFFTLLWHKTAPGSGDEPGSRLKLIGTLGANKTIEAHTAFTLSEEPEHPEDEEDNREAHHAPEKPGEGGAAPPPLLRFKMESLSRISVALVDLVTSGDGHTEFFREMRAPLDLLDLTLGSDDFTNARTRSLSRDRWNDPVVELHTEGLSLPFLRDGDRDMPRWLEVTKVEPHQRFADHQIDCDLGLALNLGSIRAEGAVRMTFDWEQFAFRIQPGTSFDLTVPPGTGPFHGDFLGLDWTFTPAPDHRLFTLDLAQRAFAVKQAPGSELAVKFTRATAPGQGIEMDVTGFAIGPGGVSLKAAIKPTSAKFLGVDTFFRLDAGSFELKDNRIADFVLEGSGDLPPALVGDARAKVKLHFGQRDGRGPLRVLSASAELLGKPRLICEGTRFNISVDAFGLEYVDDGAHQHFYFTITGIARYTPLAGDNAQGPLAWLPRIEMRLLNAPLCGDPTVLRDHIQFLAEMPHKPSFALLGCFSFELRAIAFEPRTKVFDPITDAMRVSGQVKFSDSGGDAIEVKIDFHNLYIGLPEPGHFLPRLHLKGLGVKVRSGDAFELAGEVDFLEGQIEPGVPGDGFAGSGTLRIQGLPTIVAVFTFVRVLDRDLGRHVRAWFLYAEARQMSLQIPDLPIWIREIGLGFGYRYTLAMIHTGDDVDDPREQLRILSEQSQTQGNLSRRDQWRLDLDGDARFTIALRALIAAASAGKTWNDWNKDAESILPCLAMMDAVIALRSDLTFLMTARGWLFTNYYDFLTSDDIKDHPLISGFVYLSPKRRRFLAHVESHPGAAFGDHPPIPFFLKEAIRQSRFSATLLVEPGLFHAELGWPNGLQWQLKLGPLLAEFMGGMITRVSTREFVQGTSFIAHGQLDIRAGIDLGFVGASLSVVADVRFGARYIFAIRFDRSSESALYSAIGIEICAQVSIDFWIEINAIIGTITLHFGFSFEIQFTALLETAVASNGPGIRATGTIAVRLMGFSLGLRVQVGLNGGAVDRAKDLTEPYLHVGMEASEVEPIPGEQPPHTLAPAGPVPHPLVAAAPHALAAHAVVAAAAPAPPPPPPPDDADFAAPEYQVVTHEGGDDFLYILLLPNPAAGVNQPMPFLPPPPDTPEGFADPDLVWAAPAGGFGQLQRWSAGGGWTDANAPEVQIHCEWTEAMGEGPDKEGTTHSVNLAKWLRQSYIQQSSYPRSNPHALDLQRLADDQRDHRVGHPARGSYEAAILGATERILASPYLKRDQAVPYEEILATAFVEDTTAIYWSDAPNADDALKQRKAEQSAHEHRGMLVRRLLDEVHKYAALPAAEQQPYALGAIAFRLGLVFRMPKPLPSWLTTRGQDMGQIRQRLRRNAANLSNAQPVMLFNEDAERFDRVEGAPRFRDVVVVADVGSVGVSWELDWTRGNADDLEDRLLYCQIERQLIDRPLGEKARRASGSRTFRVKVGDALAPAPGRALDSQQLVRVPSRFKFTDHFAEETPADLAALPPDGLHYRYVITPVDIAGRPSVRPYTVVALRRPNVPPLVPADGLFVLEYDLSTFPSAQSGWPRVLEPIDGVVRLKWTEPERPEGYLAAPTERYYLVFRREPTLPLGRYPADAAAGASSGATLPASNARRLHGDIAVRLSVPSATPGEERPLGVTIAWQALKDAGVIDGSGLWRPEGWRLFMQTQANGDNGVLSGLTPVQNKILFLGKQPRDPTGTRARLERNPEWIEWLPHPLQPAALPGPDTWVRSATMTVPIPPAGVFDPTGALPLTLTENAAGQQALGFDWNQGSTEATAPPAELQAGYRFYEYDLDEHTAELLEKHDAAKAIALSRRIQNAEILPPAERWITPPHNNEPDQWDAWYPSLAARMAARPGHNRPFGSTAELPPWHSWIDAQLVWPPLSAVTDPDPFFSQVRKELEGGKLYRAEIIAAPAVDAPDRAGFVKSTAAARDPWGWNLLRRLELSSTWVLRDAATGAPADPEVAMPALRTALDRILTAHPELKPHAFLECLLQPGMAFRLQGDGVDNLREADSLSLVQLSLRPVVQETWKFWAYTVPGRTGRWTALTVTAPAATITPAAAATLTVRLAGGGHLPVMVAAGQASEPAASHDPLRLLARAGEVLLVRGRTGHQPQVSGTYQREVAQNGQAALVDDGAAFGFTDSPAAIPVDSWWRTEFAAADAAWLSDGEIGQWQLMSRWLERIQPDAAKLFALPAPTGQTAEDFRKEVGALQPWLDRFFTEGAGATFTGNAGPWLASAAPRRVGPVPVEPDLAGRLHLVQPLTDAWAHLYRFFILPETRYHALWMALARAPQLALPAEQVEALDAPAPFGPDASLDLVLPRRKRIAPPGLRGSRIVEAASGGEPIWEVELAQHPEQLLSERNRSLAQHLEFHQLAVASDRRYGWQEAFMRLSQVASGNLEPLVVQQDPAAVALPGAYSAPTPVPTDHMSDEIDLPARFDPRVEPALIVQWKGLLFFYEYRVSVIAQATGPDRKTDREQAELTPPVPVVSDPVEARQRAGRSQTPPHPETTCAPEAEGTGAPNDRSLSVVWRLASHWDCLPDDLRVTWAAEQPAVAGHRRTFSSLPDPEATYLIRLQRPSGLGEAQVELRFDPAENFAFSAIQAPNAAFLADVRELIPPAADALDWKLRVALHPAAGGWPTVMEGVSSRLDFGAVPPDIEFSWPAVWQLRLTEAPSAAEIVALGAMADALAAHTGSADAVSGANALRALLGQLTAAGTLPEGTPLDLSAEAPPGLDQLGELCPAMTRADLPTGAQKRFTWRGGFQGTQRASLLAWRDALPAGTPERAALDALIAGVDNGQADVTIALDAAWTPRPSAIDLVGISAPLAARLMIARGRLGLTGPMRRGEAEALLAAATEPAPRAANQAAVRRLFTRSLDAAAPDSNWQLHVRRASLVETHAPVKVTL